MIEFIRAIVRPILAVTAVLGTFILLLLRIPIPETWWGLAIGAMTFYFVHRHDERSNPH